MSYRTPEQELDKPIQKILDGIMEYSIAVDERIRSHDSWTTDHLNKINAARLRLLAIQIELVEIQASTW